MYYTKRERPVGEFSSPHGLETVAYTIQLPYLDRGRGSFPNLVQLKPSDSVCMHVQSDVLLVWLSMTKVRNVAVTLAKY